MKKHMLSALTLALIAGFAQAESGAAAAAAAASTKTA